MTFRMFLFCACLPILVLGCGGEPQREQQADRLLAMAARLADQGFLKASRDSAEIALRFFEEAGHEGRTADAERILGDLDAASASFDDALIRYRSALQHYRGNADRAAARSMLLTIADLDRQMGNDEEAYARYEEALRLAGALKDPEGGHEIASAMLPLARTLGRSEMENTLLEGMNRTADSTGDPAAQARARNETALSAFHRGDAAGAIRNLVEALGFSSRTADSLLTATILRNLARGYETAGSVNEAMSSYTEALRLADRMRKGTLMREELLMRVGNALLRLHRPADAERFYQAAGASATARGDDLHRAYTLLQLSHCSRASLPDSARSLARTALSLLQESAPPAGMAYALGTQGLASLAANRPAEAVDLLRRASDEAEVTIRHRDDEDLLVDCEAAALGTRPAPWHEESVDLLLRLDRREEALALSLRRSRWLLFRDLSLLKPSLANDSLNTLLARWHDAAAHCAGAEEQLDRALTGPAGRRERIPEVAKNLAQAQELARTTAAAINSLKPSAGAFVGASAPGLESLRQRLPEGTALLLYGTTRHTVHIFVVAGRKTSAAVVAMDRDRLENLCRQYQTGLRQLGTGADSLSPAQMLKIDRAQLPAGSPLYDAFIRPVEGEIASMRALLIAPPDDLPWIPLHALRRRGMPGTSLIERCPVSYVYPAILSSAPVIPRPVKSVVAFGYAGSSAHDVEYELRDIRAFFKEARFLFSAQAMLQSLERENGDLVHLALDLRWDPFRSGNSSFSLPDPKTFVMKDLPIGELARVSSFPSMVVYNCSADAEAGARQIAAVPLGAGVQSVVLNGLSTGRKGDKIFGGALYTALLSGLPLPEAFRAATMDIMRRKEGISPFWASFALWVR
jgi:tetratricopeptide (TPR) repeat protein